MSDEQIRLLGRLPHKFGERHIDTGHADDLVAIDTLIIDHLHNGPVTIHPNSERNA